MVAARKQRNILGDIDIVQPLVDGSLSERVIKESEPVARVHNLSQEDFITNFLERPRPVIIEDISKNWPAMSKWSFEYFNDIVGNVEVDTDIFNVAATRHETMAEFIKRVKAKNSEVPAYLQEWMFLADYPGMRDDFEIPQYFSDDWARRLMGFPVCHIFMGEQGGKTVLHQDRLCLNAWSLQVKGEKQWIFFDREAELFANDESDVDIESFLHHPTTNATHCITKPGDVLFFPYKWWHGTKLLSDSISLHVSYITPDILQSWIRSLISVPLGFAVNRDEQAKEVTKYNRIESRLQSFAKIMQLPVETD